MCWWYIGFIVKSAHRLKAVKNPTGLMRAVLKCLSQEQFYYVSGVVETAKVEVLTEKFCQLYPTIIGNPDYRSAARRVGQPVVNLFWWPLKPRGSWEFVLLSDQRLPKEKMRDARRRGQRIKVLGEYYQCVRKPGDGWTWEMTDAHYSFWQRQLMRAVGRKDPGWVEAEAQRLVRVVSLYKGVRDQAFRLLAETRSACKANGKPDVKIPTRLPIMKFLPVYSGASVLDQIREIQRESLDVRAVTPVASQER